MADGAARQIVFTLTARCRDCYRCLRACPVKAIRMEKVQAYVDVTRCISCGTCIRECPQKAKSFRNDIDVAEKMIESGSFVVASIAPSFAAVFTAWQRGRLPSALRALGFRYVGQTAHGAYQVSAQTAQLSRGKDEGPHVGTACPAVINYMEKYRPDLIGYLARLVSPMVAHARMLKKRFGKESRVIFIGPCVAKKSEIERADVAGAVDCVLTFEELAKWLEQRSISLSTCEESSFDEKPVPVAQLYPLPGGMIKTAGLDDDGLNLRHTRVDGFENVREMLDSLPAHGKGIVEPLWCSQGCINGPGIGIDKNLFSRRRDIMEYDRDAVDSGFTPEVEETLFLGCGFKEEPGVVRQISEEEIQRVFERTGKADPQQQLNCGACGYESCREKAKAVVLGMAEEEMCIPNMRRLAERRTDRIIDTSPNGIIILDEELTIISMNPTFQKFFSCSGAVLGRHISYLMDPAPFEKLISGMADSLDITVTHRSYNLLCRELLYILKEERQIVGIFVNITTQQEHEKKLNEIRSQTIQQANDLLEHQLRMAQQMAQFLGENTARGEALVWKLMSLSEGDEKKPG
jgi:iron only hydrogenase large subunit-like protein/uncharacterized Fe-S cluster-containing protein